VSILTFLKYAPEFLNADVLMNSVMSLQNITLFYWGQNRLLNILPASVALIRNPLLNLMAVQLLGSFAFYGFLLTLSYLATLLTSTKNYCLVTLKTFVLISTIFVVTLKPQAIYEIAIWHIEYTIPSIMLGLAFHLLACKKQKNLKNFFIWVILIFIAIGVNPGSAILLFFVIFSYILYKRKIEFQALLISAIALLAFVLWSYISKLSGGISYSQFDVLLLDSGLRQALIGIIQSWNSTLFLLISISLLLTRIIFFRFYRFGENKNLALIFYVAGCIALFSVLWLFLLSMSRWVEANGFAARYFTYVIFGFLFLLAILLSDIFSLANKKATNIFSSIAALIVVVFLSSPLIPYDQYKIFTQVNLLTKSSSGLYAGNYWVVWPSVLRDLIEGYESYGLAYRAEGNQVKVRDFILRKIKQDGNVSVFCLNEKPRICIDQINSMAGPLNVRDIEYEGEGVSKIILTKFNNQLNFRAPAFLELPSQVGHIENVERVSDGRSGFIIYGPYAPVKAGYYRLNVYGSVTELHDAYVDVTSNKGNIVHAKFDFRKPDSKLLVANKIVRISGDIPDIEVRVWVGSRDVLKLSGYSFEPSTTPLQ